MFFIYFLEGLFLLPLSLSLSLCAAVFCLLCFCFLIACLISWNNPSGDKYDDGHNDDDDIAVFFSHVQRAIRFNTGSLFYLEGAVKRGPHVHTSVGYSIFRPLRHALSN